MQKWIILFLVILLIGCEVDQPICPVEIEVPQMFSPNDDGEKDVLKADIIGARKWKCTIYNRWGEVMDSTKNQELLWDGNSAEMDVIPGIYVYRIEGIDFCGSSFEKRGNLVLIK